MRVLILGGTTEANALVRHIQGRGDLSPILSLAGRTRSPVIPATSYRIGGFGGVDGLRSYLQDERIAVVIDATHPFAAGISANAAVACGDLGVPLAGLTRPAWDRQAGDRWIRVGSLKDAVGALGEVARRVLLTIGGVQLAAFAMAPWHNYVVRTIDPPDAAVLPPSHRLILARGPFAEDDEVALMRRERIDVLVTKNSGGTAVGAKIIAARRLGLEVVMIERPAIPDIQRFVAMDAVVAWIDDHRPPP